MPKSKCAAVCLGLLKQGFSYVTFASWQVIMECLHEAVMPPPIVPVE